MIHDRESLIAAHDRLTELDSIVELINSDPNLSQRQRSDELASLRGLIEEIEQEIRQAACATMQEVQRERMQYLHDQQQRPSLSPEEKSEEQKLLGLYRETILLRAQAAVLLKLRGYDISDPSQFLPLA